MPRLAVLGHGIVHDLPDPARDLVPKRGPFEDRPALAVDDLALLVHDVVVIDDVAAGVEVVALDLGLRPLDLARDQARLDRLVLLDPQPVHHAPDALAAADAHQVVVQPDEEARRARVTMTPGTAAQLVVDPPALVALGADDVQPA